MGGLARAFGADRETEFVGLDPLETSALWTPDGGC